jgi:hypothetical protein
VKIATEETRHQMDQLQSVIVKGILESGPAADISKLDPLLTQVLDSMPLRIIGQDGKETVVTLDKQSVADNLTEEHIHLLEKIPSGRPQTSFIRNKGCSIWTRIYDLLLRYDDITTNSFSYSNLMNAVLFFRFVRVSVPILGVDIRSKITISMR